MQGRVTLVGYVEGPALQFVTIQFEDGRVPFVEFLDSLEWRDQAMVADRFHKIAVSGLEWLSVSSRSVGSGVYELRHPRQLRIFWMRYGQSVVLLLGGVKKNVGPRQQSVAIEASIRLAKQVKGEMP
jgi:putative component of toxin-antitoxin plasmid stabilization module